MFFTECKDVNWKYFNNTNNCYRYVNQELNWNDAKKHCQSLPSKLVAIHSEEEMNFLEQKVVHGVNFKSGGSTGIWIGGYEINGKWNWDDGSEFDWKNWEKTQPNAPKVTDTIDDCAYLWTTERYEWADARCDDYSFPFICMS